MNNNKNTCRACGLNLFPELRLYSQREKRTRCKAPLANIIKEKFNVDIKQDCPSWPTHMHNSCYIQIQKGKFEGPLATFPVSIFTDFYLYYEIEWLVYLFLPKF